MPQYRTLARVYDAVSGERLVYAAGRTAGVRLLAPARGDVVVDLACGTGLNFPALQTAVGEDGLILGIDRSLPMLRMAALRATRAGWGNIRLVQADAATVDVPALRGILTASGRPDGADGLIATYALSVIDDRDQAWHRATGVLRAGARAAIVDMQPPDEWPWSLLAPLARLACAAGGADIRSHPWRLLERDADDVRRVQVKGGHIVAAAGTLGAQRTTDG